MPDQIKCFPKVHKTCIYFRLVKIDIFSKVNTLLRSRDAVYYAVQDGSNFGYTDTLEPV